MVQASGGDFDVIIDDGGHTMKQQITTMDYLIPNALKPGGLFFMEDLLTCFLAKYLDFNDQRTTQHIYSLTDDLHKRELAHSGLSSRYKPALSSLFLSVDCMREICVIERIPNEKKLKERTK
jgi:hypothetical protein